MMDSELKLDSLIQQADAKMLQFKQGEGRPEEPVSEIQNNPIMESRKKTYRLTPYHFQLMIQESKEALRKKTRGGHRKFVMTEEQVRLVQEFGDLSELSPKTYLSTARAALQRNDPKGERISQTAIQKVVDAYARKPLEFMSGVGEFLNGNQKSPSYVIDIDYLSKNPPKMAHGMMTLWLKEYGMTRHSAVMYLNHTGNLQVDWGLNAQEVAASPETANILANLFNLFAEASGVEFRVSRPQIKQF